MNVRYIRHINKSVLDSINIEDETGIDKVIKVFGGTINPKHIKELKEGDVFVVDTLATIGFDATKNLNLIIDLLTRNIKVIIEDFGEVTKDNLRIFEMIQVYESQSRKERLLSENQIEEVIKNPRKIKARSYSKEEESQIIRLLNANVSYSKISDLTGLSRATICRVKKRYEEENK